MQGDGNFLSDILLRGDLGAVAGLDDLDFGVTQATQTLETSSHARLLYHGEEIYDL